MTNDSRSENPRGKKGRKTRDWLTVARPPMRDHVCFSVILHRKIHGQLASFKGSKIMQIGASFGYSSTNQRPPSLVIERCADWRTNQRCFRGKLCGRKALAETGKENLPGWADMATEVSGAMLTELRPHGNVLAVPASGLGTLAAQLL